MRPVHRPLIAFLGFSSLGIAAACGSSSNGNNSSNLGTDSGEGGTEDSSMTESGSGGGDSGSHNDATTGHDGGTTTDGGDGGILGANCPAVDAGTFVEAKHGPLPTVTYYGGPVMTNPLVVTFTFKDTPNAAALDAFGASITSTPWFTQVTKDYCVPDGGPCITGGTAGISVAISTNADPTYVETGGTTPPDGGLGGTDLNLFMNQQIAAAVAANTIPAPTANTLYAFYFPPTTTITGYGTSCIDYGAYHSAQLYSDNTTPIVYAIMPDCPTGDPKMDLEQVDIAASHEIAEAVTDPNSNGVPAWYMDQWGGPDAGITQPEYRNDPWLSQQFGEVGDNCESIPLQTWPLNDAGTVAQRIWSISAASAGHNPCVPVPTGEAYYNASTDKVIYVANVGDTFTVDVSAFSDMARSSWRLDAVDGTPTQMTGADGGGPLQYLKLEFVGGVTGSDGVSSLLCVNNGTTGQVKVTLLADPSADTSLQQQQEWPEADGVIYSADVAAATNTPLPDGGSSVTFPYQFWPFAVITPAVAATIGVTSSGINDMARLRALRAVHHAQKAGHGVMPLPRARTY
jgi:hypothetical protein